MEYSYPLQDVEADRAKAQKVSAKNRSRRSRSTKERLHIVPTHHIIRICAFALKRRSDMKNLAILLSAAAILYLLPSLAVAEDPGAALFQSHCQMCHGADGKAATPTGKAFKAVDFHDPAVMKLSDTELAAIITKGKNNMPAFGARLTQPQIQSLISYIHVLQKR